VYAAEGATPDVEGIRVVPVGHVRQALGWASGTGRPSR
jgi:hypothetical protein